MITHEEFTAYGSTSFQGFRNFKLDTPRIYRYTGAELGDETSLSYHGSRYYSTILGVWISADPLSVEAGSNLYVYAGSNPIMRTDRGGGQWEDIGDDPGLQAVVADLNASPPDGIANAPAKPTVEMATTPPKDLKEARKPAANMQRRERRAYETARKAEIAAGTPESKARPKLPRHVNVSHGVGVKEGMNVGLASSEVNRPGRTMMATSSKTIGNESGSIGGGPSITKHNLNEAHVLDTAASFERRGMKPAEALVAAADQVQQVHENTHLDWKKAQGIVNSDTRVPDKQIAEVNAEAARIATRKDQGGGGGGGGGPSGGGGGASTEHTPSTPHASASPSWPSAPHAPSESHTPHASATTGSSLSGRLPVKSVALGAAATAAESLAPEEFAEAALAMQYTSYMLHLGGHAAASAALGDGGQSGSHRRSWHGCWRHRWSGG